MAVVQEKKLNIFENDLSDELFKQYMACQFIAVDTETRGLNLRRDRLCLVQISDQEGNISLIRFPDRNKLPMTEKTKLRQLLEAPNVLKVMHYARFDVGVLNYYLGAKVNPIWCTKIASKLARTYADKHSLKDLAYELLGVEVDKSNQTSDWARSNLSPSQLQYAANDVRLLVPIYLKMKELIAREELDELAKKLFDFLPVVCQLDSKGWNNIFEH